MTKKIVLCDGCNETISIGKCNLCGKELCRYCAYLLHTEFHRVPSTSEEITYLKSRFLNPINRGSAYEDMPILCYRCYRKIKEGLTAGGTEKIQERMRGLSKGILKFILDILMMEEI